MFLLHLSFLRRLHHVLWTVLVLLLGYAMGTLMLRMERVQAPLQIIVRKDVRRKQIPVVNIQEINRGSIIGSIGSGVRLTIGQRMITPDETGAFRIDAAPFLMNIVNIVVPSDARFVASSKGKKYYPVESKKWLAWKSEPVFFQSGEEAEMAGYERGK